MPRILGELKDACTEQLSADPGGTVQGRIWTNTTENRIKTDDGTNKRALLRNDQNAVIGNSGTANNNVRLHRGDAELLQFVRGADATVEASMSTDLAKISAKLESYTDAGKPAFGNAGRSIYLTDTNTLSVDTGSAWNNLLAQSLATTKGDILARSASELIRLGVGSDGQILTADSAETTGMRWASPGTVSTTTHSSAYSASIGDGVSYNDTSGGGYTITLPSAAGNNGEQLTFQKTDSSTNLLAIGAITSLNTQNEKVTIRSNGTSWVVEEQLIPKKFFQSSAVGLGGSATTHTASHGLGGVPTLWKVFLRCVTTQFGYAVNDEIEVPGYSVSGSVGCTSFANSTTVGFRVGSQVIVSRRDALADAGLTPANWQIFFRAWRHI